MLEALVELLRGRRVVVLTGAGVSTESGIPDYRGPDAPKRVRPPMQYREFVGSAAARQRYWARSALGWERFRSARPSAPHLALSALAARGKITGLITQNVDRLHRRAGHEEVVELHGALEDVRCLDCGNIIARDALQARLIAANPELASLAGTRAPIADGDAEYDPARDFVVIPCALCGGVLKPDVVFFGEGVPAPVTRAAWETFDRGDALLVVGSSLTVFSGFRFARRAEERGWPIAIVNLGPTRADAIATIRVESRAGEALNALAGAL